LLFKVDIFNYYYKNTHTKLYMSWYNFWKKENRNIIGTGQEKSALGLDKATNNKEIPAMSLSAVFAAVELISNSVAELPIMVKTQKENQVSIIDNHPIYRAFNNSVMTKYMIIKMMIQDMLLYGDGFAYIKRAADGTPIEIIYLPHGTVSINWNQSTQTLYYMASSIKSGRIEPINMIHLLKNSNNGVTGVGVLNYAYNTLSLVGNTEAAALEYFQSGCHVAGILTTNVMSLDEEQADDIREAWQRGHGKNGTGMAVLGAGMQYQPVSSNSKDAQMLETRLFNIQDIARFFNINPVLLGDLSHSSYSTIEASLLEFVTHTLFPYITLVEEELTRKLIKVSEKGLYVDLDENFILRSDKTSQANYLNTLVKGGILTPNEARQQLGLNAIDGCNDLIIPYSDISQNKVNSQPLENNSNNSV
jgi:HK97 family phage portal protein